MASSKSVNVVRQVGDGKFEGTNVRYKYFSLIQIKPLLSVSKSEARLRVLALYKAWHRQIPFICVEYDMPVNPKMCREKVKEKFLANANVKDTRVIDMLVVKV